MHKTEMIGRRRFVKIAIGGIASIPVIAAGLVKAEGDVAQLTEDDAQAVALGYKHAGESIDTTQYPRYTSTQTCSSCALYQGEEGAEWGNCAIFPSKQVSASGWCTAYAAKPA